MGTYFAVIAAMIAVVLSLAAMVAAYLTSKMVDFLRESIKETIEALETLTEAVAPIMDERERMVVGCTGPTGMSRVIPDDELMSLIADRDELRLTIVKRQFKEEIQGLQSGLGADLIHRSTE